MNSARYTKVLLIGAIAATASGMLLVAQEGSGTPPATQGDRSSDGSSQGGPGRGDRPPKPPLELALDANQDGTIDADEIANATTALKELDKNGDGQLTPDEYRPPRPPRQGGQGGAGGPGGEGPGRADSPPAGAR
jgi:hypothetical protein